ncbi:hypothetical protein M758_2G090400 [Ceratodon purpureus]|nr:hypothetical protein M758_2G090400 [Ceratodon purpureus]
MFSPYEWSASFNAMYTTYTKHDEFINNSSTIYHVSLVHRKGDAFVWINAKKAKIHSQRAIWGTRAGEDIKKTSNFSSNRCALARRDISIHKTLSLNIYVQILV